MSGPSVSLAILAVAGLCIPIALTYGELISMLPFAGGEVNYTHAAFNKDFAFWVGWIMIFAYLTIAVMLTLMFVMIAQYLIWPAMPFGTFAAISIIAALIIAIITTFKMIVAVRLQFVMFCIFLAVGIVTALFFWTSPHYNLSNAQPFFYTGLPGFGIAVGLMVTCFVGFDIVPQLAEEAKYPSVL